MANFNCMHRTLTIENETSELIRVTQLLEEVGEELCLDPVVLMNLMLVIEEAVSNVILYAYGKEEKGQTIDLSLSFVQGVLTAVLTDTGLPFDPMSRKDPDLTLSAEERQIGGLGIFLIKTMMDEVTYRREGDRNVLVMKKVFA